MNIRKTVINTIIIVVLTTAGLMAFVRISSSGNNNSQDLTEVRRGNFEISVSNIGELVSERSADIKGPNIVQSRFFRAAALKITDLVPEGTIVRKGDYVATLDRSSFSNSLKDEINVLKVLDSEYDMKLLDTAVVLSTLRDDIKNQMFAVEEAEIVVESSVYEPPANIRKAEIDLDKANRFLEQKKRTYFLRLAQNSTDIRNRRIELEQQQRKVKELEQILTDFTVIAPQDGMIVYKRDRLGNKISTGSILNPFDPSVATLPDLTSIISKIYVSEIDINKISIGQPVQIDVDAFRGKTYKGYISAIANIGEILPNSDSKVFEVLAKFEDLDQMLRPTMTTSNKVITKTFDDILYIPLESLHTGTDKIPFVYTKDEKKQVVIPGEMNDKFVIIEKGLAEGTSVFLSIPEKSEKFKFSGTELIAEIRERENARESGDVRQNRVLAEGISSSSGQDEKPGTVFYK